MSLDTLQRERYARHLTMPEIGEAGQERLAAARVLLVGAGGLGSAAGFYLAAAGVGTIDVMDGDTVELSNLQRQILHTTSDLGRPKAVCASDAMSRLNPNVRAVPHSERLTPANAAVRLHEVDFVIDATDNFASKFLIADACHGAGCPYAHAGILRFQGQALTVIPGRSACYRCLFERPPDETDASPPQGPLGAVPGVIGALQAGEAVKYLLGVGRLLTDRLFVFDVLEGTCRIVPARRNPRCALCGKGA